MCAVGTVVFPARRRKGTTCVVTLATDIDDEDALFEEIAGTIRAI
ncbi:hypothetical protein Misp02_56920 [Microtetraspora sp. NBRC 16547]|nr:hypothetical protein Misp02_56920 [Microtetraspora sp. NBRC 16547]